MSKAEDRAKERYWLEPSNIDTQNKYQAYLEGYQQAEKDLTLTLVDIKKICLIAREVHKYYGFWSDIVYQDVLIRFNEQKGK